MATDRVPRSQRRPRPGRAPQVLSLRRVVEPPVEQTALERELLAFDAGADVENGVVMPPNIPPAARAAITTLIARRFAAEDVGAPEADALETWLYAPHPLLAGECPFDRLVAGDALAVLIALVDPPADLLEALDARTRTASPPPRRPRLTLVR